MHLRESFFCIIMVIANSLCIGEEKKWETTRLIWNVGLASQFASKENSDPYLFFSRGYVFPELSEIEKSVVWIRPAWFRQFYNERDKIKTPVVVVVCDGDESFPSDCIDRQSLEELLKDKKILHIFAQNCDYMGSSSKISPIPIGIDFHTLAYKGLPSYWGEVTMSPWMQETILKRVASRLKPTHERKKKIYIDFHFHDTMRTGCFQRYLQWGEDRQEIFNRLMLTGLVEAPPKPTRRTQLWMTKGQYAFSVSPHGNGLDCHRTWEDLALGCIVIVKTSPLDRLYEDLPVVIVKDWAEVTEENLEKWLAFYGNALENPTYRERLSMQFWLHKIKAEVNLYEASICDTKHEKDRKVLQR